MYDVTNHIAGDIINTFQLVMKWSFPVMAHSEAEIKVAIRTVVWILGYFEVWPVQEAVILMFVKGPDYL